MKLLNDFVAGLKFGEPQKFGRLTIRPIISETDLSLPFLTLEEALAKDILEITEVGEEGSVPDLLVKNTGDTDVILIEGEILEGAKQNRMVNATTIVPAEGEIILPVTCVERGRWSYRSRKFASGGHVAYPKMRKASHEAVRESVRRDASRRSDQGQVWRDIGAKMDRMKIKSETEAATDLEDQVMRCVASTYKESVFDKIRHVDRQVGYLAYIEGGFAGGDIFGSPEICSKQVDKLTRGYLMDMEDRAMAFPVVSDSDLFEGLRNSEFTEHVSVGKGIEMRFHNGKVQGACSVVDGLVSHVTVFPVE